MITDLDSLVDRIPDGASVAVAPDYSGCAMAAVRALIRRGVRSLHLIAVPQAGPLEHLEAVPARHLVVCDHHVENLLVQGTDRLEPVLGLHHLVARLPERRGDALPEVLLVFRYQLGRGRVEEIQLELARGPEVPVGRE